MALMSGMLSNWRHKIIAPYIKGDVLDIGCGNAVIFETQKELINRYVGVERHPKRTEMLSRKFPDALFIHRDLDSELLNVNAEFDVILMIAVIEHVWNQKYLFEQLIRMLKRNGKIILTSPTPFGNDFIHPVGAKLGIFAQSAVDDHIVIYNKRRFLNLSKELGLNLDLYKRFQFFSNQLAVLEKQSAE